MIAFAWLALWLWPIVAIVLYQRLSLAVAFCATIFGGYLLLPHGIGLDLPILPRLDKYSIPVLSALLLTSLKINQMSSGDQILQGWIPRNTVAVALLCTAGFATFGTVATNPDTLVYGRRVIGGLRLYDAFSYSLEILILILPLLLARRILATPSAQRTLLITIAGSGLIYSIPTLWEVRMSPQLNVHIYGFFPHSFLQHMRQGGFRPLVFLNHGLSLGIFMSFAVIAAACLFRISQGRVRMQWAWAIVWLFVTLVLAKSVGALLTTMMLLPVVLIFNTRLQILVAACIAGTILIYPILRSAHLVPLDQIMSIAQDISPQRAASLNTRIQNEEILLAKALERPLFGWGGWGRNRVFNANGTDISITDGSWALEIGLGGWFRYIAVFGLLCWPIIHLAFFRRKGVDPVCAALALVLAAKLVDLIPNSGMQPIIWLMAGALWGRLEMKQPVQEQAPLGEPLDPAAVHALHAPGRTVRKVTYARTFPQSDQASEASVPDDPAQPGLRYRR